MTTMTASPVKGMPSGVPRKSWPRVIHRRVQCCASSGGSASSVTQSLTGGYSRAALATASPDQAEGDRAAERLSTARRFEFGVHPNEVRLDGRLTDRQLGGYLPVGATGRQQPEHFPLTRRQHDSALAL